jgi:acetoin:2,6-dichlorophenolindophenol oxidoreductase subunit alpha
MATRVEKQRAALPISAQPGNFQASNPLITDARLKQLYSTILRYSVLRQRVRRLRGKSKSTAKYSRSFGEEAAVVGAAIQLRRDDWLAPAPGDTMAGFLRGAPLAEIISEFLPHAASRDVSTHESKKNPALNVLPPPATIAAQLGVASGVAMAMKAAEKGNIVLVLCGVARTAGKPWQEALNFAGTHCLPLVVLVQAKVPIHAVSTKHYAVSTNLILKGRPCDFPVIPVDAHDAVAMYRVAQESIHKARYGGGPTVIEATTFRRPERSRPANSPDLHATDAVARMEDYLTGKGIFSLAWKRGLVEEFDMDINSAVESTRAVFPSKQT